MFYTKNNRKITHFNKLLIALTAFLAISYFLSFTKSCSSGDRREKIKSALVNQKYLENISFITLQDASGALELNNYKGFWTLQRISDYSSSQLQNTPSIPLAPERMNNFLNELIKVRNLYKISDKINKNSSLGLNNGTEFHITYAIPDSEGDTEGFRELIFGNQDFSLSSRYLMTGESTQVYEIDDSMDIYLTTSIQSWAEPYIISRAVQNFQSTDIQSLTVTQKEADGRKSINKLIGNKAATEKLCELRHGGLPEVNEILTSAEAPDVVPDLELEIEKGNKSKIILEIFALQGQESSYLVKADYFNADSASAFYTAYSKISAWTYNKIKEITL